jgi:hypothetical protein
MSLDEAFARLRGDEMRPGTCGGDPWRPVAPIPDDAPPQLTRNTIERHCPVGYRVTNGWRYRDAAGKLFLWIVRYDRPANGRKPEKEFKPFTYCEGPGGRCEWRCKNLRVPRSLYGLDRLATRPGAPVLVTEGEKTADAAAERFKDHVCITSPGGSNAARQADWSALAGRAVTIWLDNDQPGACYAADVADMLQRPAQP